MSQTNTGSVKIKLVPSSSNTSGAEASTSTNIVLNGQGLLSNDTVMQAKQTAAKEKKSRKRSEKKDAQAKGSQQ